MIPDHMVTNDNNPKTKTIIVNDQNFGNDFKVTSIPEGADLRNNLNQGVEDLRRIILPESETNAEEEVIIIPQNGNIDFNDGRHSNEQTADKILALISEIGSNKILQKDEKNFHPWFWEHAYGQVMTI